MVRPAVSQPHAVQLGVAVPLALTTQAAALVEVVEALKTQAAARLELADVWAVDDVQVAAVEPQGSDVLATFALSRQAAGNGQWGD